MMSRGQDIAVLFVHGIQGSPQQFRFLEAVLPEQVEIRNLLLPGHGGSVRDFLHSGKEVWLDNVQKEVLALHRSGKRIIYVGHSMGCLIGLLVARKTDISFGRTMFLCCPFRLCLTRRYFRNFIWALIRKKNSSDPFIYASQAANSIRARHAVGYLGCIPPYIELFRLIRQVERLDWPVLDSVAFYFSALDEIVSPKSIQIAARYSSEAPHILTGCGHNYFTDNAKRHLQGRLLQMVDEVSREENGAPLVRKEEHAAGIK